MLNKDGFDLWSDRYDVSVKEADERNQYPFAGYTRLMNAIYGTIMEHSPAKVLDIGFGTALLTSRLYDAGNQITGIDFSAEMIRIASIKMPTATLLQWDFSLGIPPVLSEQSFDFIVSTYALHHLTDAAKVSFISSLLNLLEAKGVLLIGDVCFRSREELRLCKAASRDSWDNDEVYFVVSELEEQLSPVCELVFHEFSFCSGVIEFRKKP
ncbi:class I SAM-dependent methyltransferase [Oscillospiraceae bacterium HV4-5-C5C]|nr:class I SAM-dependent methyltransferase [Oscillospiraceae bacterium HV4-5-C5C]